MPVYNALAAMIASGSLLSRPDAPRLQYYSNLTAAISSGKEELAQTIGETYGWELDIMKASFTFHLILILVTYSSSPSFSCDSYLPFLHLRYSNSHCINCHRSFFSIYIMDFNSNIAHFWTPTWIQIDAA
jgi:hypothetical protein